MRFKFSKMHGLGNDFVVIDAVNQSVDLSPSDIQRLADRHLGVGCDQILMVAPPSQPDSDFDYLIYNSDGSKAGHCGNGARCLARFIHEQKLSDKKHLILSTFARNIDVTVESFDSINVDMGQPDFSPTAIGLNVDDINDTYTTEVDKQTITFSAVSFGNPHAVIQVDDIEAAPVKQTAKALQQSSLFSEGVNVGFAEIVSPNKIKLRVYERGAGETLACGTGACAAVVCLQKRGLLEPNVTVSLKTGELEIRSAQSTQMSGPAAQVFEGTYDTEQ